MESRRGGNFGTAKRKSLPPTRTRGSILTANGLPQVASGSSNDLTTEHSRISSAEHIDDDQIESGFSEDVEEEGFADKSAMGEDMHMELRNPSDALQILANSEETTVADGAKVQLPRTDSQERESLASPRAYQRSHRGNDHCGTQPQSRTLLLDGYELVRNGLLHATTLLELIDM